jgi:hypothetical protein
MKTRYRVFYGEFCIDAMAEFDWPTVSWDYQMSDGKMILWQGYAESKSEAIRAYQVSKFDR